MAAEHDPQQISRLTPVAEVTARIDALVKPVAPRRMVTTAAAGRVLAEDIVAAAAVPAAARALRDGFAVLAEATSDASAYAPVPLTPPQPVDAGSLLPVGADAVAPLDMVVERDGRLAAIAPVAPGDGVLAAGADIRAGAVLQRAGDLVSAAGVAALTTAGIAEVTVREPRICIAPARPGNDAVVAAAADLIAGAVAAAGGAPRRASGDLPSVFADRDADAFMVVGGTGCGRNDASVRALAAAGRLEVHGVALTPGETAAFGMIGPRPALLVPGRLDAALAIWLTLGCSLLTRMSGRTLEAAGTTVVLTRKHASPLGLTELVPVRTNAGKAEPIASGYWSLEALAYANGWILVPPDSEGYPAGAQVVLRPWL